MRRPRRFAPGLDELFLLFSLLLLTSCGGDSSSPPPPAPSIDIIPKTALVPINTNATFLAVVQHAPTNAVTWTATAGTVDSSGNYVAPASVPPGGLATVTTTSVSIPTLSASATITISSQPVTLSISPPTATAKAGLTTSFTTDVGGTSNTGVLWTVTDIAGDTAYPGSILDGAYTAPAPMLAPDTFAITATSLADPSKTASATVTAVPLDNQEAQAFPIILGASGINAKSQDCCSGTLGSLLADEKGKQYILSNNHILGRLGAAVAGEPVVQPGYVDTLCDFTKPKTVANFTVAPSIVSNVDAAVAEVVPGAVNPTGQIIGLGGIRADGSYIPAPPASTVATATVGMAVAKSGRTTGLSCGFVDAINATIQIDYPAECGNPTHQIIQFDGQVIVNNIVRPGDSGTLIVEAATARPLGLVVGLAKDGTFGSANPAMDVINALDAATKSQFSFVGSSEHAISCMPGASPLSQSAEPSQHADVESAPALAQEEVQRAIEIQSQHEKEILQHPAVIGVAIGRHHDDATHPALLVFVERGRKPPVLPVQFDGLPVQFVATARFVAGILPPDAMSRSCTHRDPQSAKLPLFRTVH